MQFVKTTIYQQEFSVEGIKEKETDARSKEHVEVEERLKKLPEFNRDPNFRSLSEQIHEKADDEDALKDKTLENSAVKFGLAAVTEDEFLFYEELLRKSRNENLQKKKNEEDELSEFFKEKKNLVRHVTEPMNTQFNVNEGSQKKNKNANHLSNFFPTNIFSIVNKKQFNATLTKRKIENVLDAKEEKEKNKIMKKENLHQSKINEESENNNKDKDEEESLAENVIGDKQKVNTPNVKIANQSNSNLREDNNRVKNDSDKEERDEMQTISEKAETTGSNILEDLLRGYTDNEVED